MSASKVNSKVSSKVLEVSKDWLTNSNKGNYTFFLQFLFQNFWTNLRI